MWIDRRGVERSVESLRGGHSSVPILGPIKEDMACSELPFHPCAMQLGWRRRLTRCAVRAGGR